jgi:hypothetical protein
VSCTISLLARCFPLFLHELSPPISPYLAARLDAVGRASPQSRVWPPHGDHGRCARVALRPSQPGRVATGTHQSGCEAMTADCHSMLPRAIGLRPRGGFGPALCEFLLKSFLIVLNSRKQFKLPKFVETCSNVQKWQTKFCMNPLEQPDTGGLTKLSFVQYFIVQNSNNSDTKIIVYKYLCL